QSDRLHRPEPQRVHAPPGHHFDRQAALEELRIVELVQRGLLGGHQRVVENSVLLGRERAVQIVALAIVYRTSTFARWAPVDKPALADRTLADSCLTAGCGYSRRLAC